VVAYSLNDINAPLNSACVEVDVAGHDDNDVGCWCFLCCCCSCAAAAMVLVLAAITTSELTSFVLDL
jgi:hypothetical protein